MFEKLKQKLQQIDQKEQEIHEKSWARKLRITGSVFWNLLILCFIFGLALFVFASSVGAGYFASLVSKEPLRSKEEMRNDILTYEETSEIYLADNVYLGKVNADIERKHIELEDVSQHVIDAVFATEDEYFETHPGIVPKAVLRGILQDVTNSASQTGGSTLTQQLIKLQILTNEVSYERKAKELLLALRLEHFMEKDEILEAYLNVIPYGRNANGDNIAGIYAAAEGIFNVKPKDLTLPQAAYIAGIPQSPFAYTPFYNQRGGVKEKENLEPGIKRMKTVLSRMKETGYITEKEYKKAVKYDITKDFRKPEQRANERYPYLTQEIQERTVDILTKILAEEDGIDPDRIDNESKLREKYAIMARRAMSTNGYRIHSTIDKELFDSMNKAAENFQHYGYTYTETVKDKETGKDVEVKSPVQVGSIMIENKTGKILSFVGGRDFSLSNVNHATQAYRANGSTMKPLLVYAPAIEYGEIGAGSPVVDIKFNINPPWNLNNFQAGQELGVIPARQALATSQNLATARLYRNIIDRDPAQYLDKMGFTKVDEDEHHNYSLSIGAMRNGTSVEENTNAFSTFANGGQFIESYMIDKIEDMDGNIIFEHKVEPVDVFSPETSYMISDMMRDVTTQGTAKIMKQNLNFGIDLAAKTGTTNDYVDAWLVGYNPNVSLGVWLGYKDNTKGLYPPSIRGSYLPPSNRVNLLFAQLMNAANASSPDIIKAGDRFQRPSGVVDRSFCGISGMAPSKACSSAGLVKTDLFNSKAFVPSKPDDSIVSSSYVYANGKKVAASEDTPSEFVVKGSVGVTKAYVKKMLGPWGGDGSKLFPENSPFAKNIVAGKTSSISKGKPSAVKASLKDNVLSWSPSSSANVIGYYVYKDGKKVKTVKDGQALSMKVGDGTYTVRAVSVSGQQSGNSNKVKFDKAKKEKDPKKDKDKEAKEKDKKKDKDSEKEKEKDTKKDDKKAKEQKEKEQKQQEKEKEQKKKEQEKKKAEEQKKKEELKKKEEQKEKEEQKKKEDD